MYRYPVHLVVALSLFQYAVRYEVQTVCAGVLPGLEEGSDHYQRTNSLLEAVVEAVNPFVFYSALWECVAANATIRHV
jgi:hypothetical protein